MKFTAMLISIAGLVLTVVPSFFVLYGSITWALHVRLMFAGMVMWFLTAPFWVKTD